MEKLDSSQNENQEETNNVLHDGWIPTQHIASFSQYKYVSPTVTYFEREILNRMWEWMIQFVPQNIAPNVITVAGLLVVLLGVGAMLWEDPTMTRQVSTWIYIYIAIAIWVYQTLGKSIK